MMLSDRGHAKNVSFLGQYLSVSYRLSSYWLPKWTDATEVGFQNLFWGEERPFNGKFQSFATKRFMRTVIHVFLPSFMLIGKAEVTKPVCGIHDKKLIEKAVRLFQTSLKRSRRKFYRVSLSPLTIPPPSFVQSFPRDIRENVSYDYYSIIAVFVGEACRRQKRFVWLCLHRDSFSLLHWLLLLCSSKGSLILNSCFLFVLLILSS